MGPWRELAAGSPVDAPFYRPEWILAYLRSFDPNANLVLVEAESGSGLAALLPLVEKWTLFSGLPARVLRGPANVHSSRFDLLRLKGQEGDEAVRSLWQYLKSRSGWDVIELPYVPADGSLRELIRLAEEDRFHTFTHETDCSPYVPLQGVQEAASIPGNSHFRANLRRRGRKARGRWDVRLRRIDGLDRAALGQFYDLEHSGWKGRNKTSILSSPDTVCFYDEIAAAGSEAGYFTLYLLDFGDKQVAGHFGLTYGGRYFCPKVAYDESCSSYGPGHLIIEAIIDDVLDRGCTEFDFLGPWMDWKAEWTSLGRQHHNLFIFQKSLFGDALYAAKAKAEAALRRAVRKYRAGRAAPRQPEEKDG